jgi:hypothetical protein
LDLWLEKSRVLRLQSVRAMASHIGGTGSSLIQIVQYVRSSHN